MFVPELTITIIGYGLLVNVVKVNGNFTDSLPEVDKDGTSTTVIPANVTVEETTITTATTTAATTAKTTQTTTTTTTTTIASNVTEESIKNSKIFFRRLGGGEEVIINATIDAEAKTDAIKQKKLKRRKRLRHTPDLHLEHRHMRLLPPPVAARKQDKNGRRKSQAKETAEAPKPKKKQRNKRQVNFLWSRRFLKDTLYDENVGQDLYERSPRNYPERKHVRRSFSEPKTKRNKASSDDDDYRKPTMRMAVPIKLRTKGKDFHGRKSSDSFHTITKKSGKKENTIVRFDPEKIRGYNGTDSTFNIETSFSEGDPNDPKNRIKCSASTDGNFTGLRGKTGDSKSQSFSEHTDDDKKTLLCKSETSEVVKPNNDVTIKYRVRGATILTNDRSNPSKFLERNVDARNDDLELGTMSRSIMHENSGKNSSGSVINAHDKKADSLSQTRSRLVHENDRSGIQTSGSADGSTNFDTSHGKPLVLTSKSQESSMVIQNPSRHLTKPLKSSKDEDIKMYATQKKSTTFDIAFRSFDLPMINPTKEKRSPAKQKTRHY